MKFKTLLTATFGLGAILSIAAALLLLSASSFAQEFEHRVCRISGAEHEPGAFKGQIYRDERGERFSQSASELERDEARPFGREVNGLFAAYAEEMCTTKRTQIHYKAHGANTWFVSFRQDCRGIPYTDNLGHTYLTYLIQGAECAELLRPDQWDRFKDELTAIALDNGDGVVPAGEPRFFGRRTHFHFEKLGGAR